MPGRRPMPAQSTAHCTLDHGEDVGRGAVSLDKLSNSVGVVDFVRQHKSARAQWSSGPSVICHSGACAAVRPSRIGSPCTSTRTWVLVLTPPRDRPRQWSGPPFCIRRLLVPPKVILVDHLHIAVMRGVHRVHQPVSYTCLSPSREAIVRGGARAMPARQIARPRSGRSTQNMSFSTPRPSTRARL